MMGSLIKMTVVAAATAFGVYAAHADTYPDTATGTNAFTNVNNQQIDRLNIPDCLNDQGNAVCIQARAACANGTQDETCRAYCATFSSDEICKTKLNADIAWGHWRHRRWCYYHPWAC
jgi:hypothetical protein